MSSTSKANRVLLLIKRRAQKSKIKKAIFDILSAVDALEGNAQKSQMEDLLGVTLHHASVMKSVDMGLITYVNIGCENKKVFSYSMTDRGLELLKLILIGKVEEAKLC